MMKRIFLIVSVLFFTALSLQAQLVDQFIFFDGSYEALQKRALNANKPYFVYFYANWCEPAKDMNEQTFSNSAFINYTQANYLGLEIDGESIITEGSALAQRYNVLYYPTVIIFTPQGKEVDRFHGFQSASVMLSKLRQNRNKTGAPSADNSDDFTYNLIEEGDNEGYLFNVSAKTQKYNGYGVQVGVFKNYRNVFLKVLELEEEKYHRNIMVYVKESEAGDDMFKIILGPFFTQDQAENYQKLIKQKQQLDGVVVELDDLDY